MLTLRVVPDTTTANFWDHASDGSDRSLNFVLWPADVGADFVRVRISTMALGDYDGKSLGIYSGDVRAALERHRDLIQRLAQSKYRPGDAVMMLDIGDFPARLQTS
jgi:hypothetical protein